ncbi:Fanconi anemia core complex-associated protein 100-like [Branchiostoma lanceolatum]|uniref:Fanconi anemia core complex-associated protein 100-like n=1 Tax=Branchiostoma lanceolatum TaxID=7740 RepID=UPI003453CA5D
MARYVSDVRVLDQVDIGSADHVRLKTLNDAVTLPGDSLTLPDAVGKSDDSAGVTVLATGGDCVHCYGTPERKVTCHCPGPVSDAHLTAVEQKLRLLCCEEGGRLTSAVLPGQSGRHDNRSKKKKAGDPDTKAKTPNPDKNQDIFNTLLDSRAAKVVNTCPTSCQVVYTTPSGSQVSDGCVQNICVIPNYVVTCSEASKGWDITVNSFSGEIGDLLWRKHIPVTDSCNVSCKEHLPSLYVAQPPGTYECHYQDHAAETLHLSAELFSSLFGVTPNLLDCPMILLGLPDGRVCTLPLKDVAGFAKPASAGHLYHLQQPVVSVHALTLMRDQSATPVGDHNMLVLVGAEGKVVLVRAGRSSLTPVFKEYQLPGPILDSDCKDGKLVYSTGTELCVVTFNNRKGQEVKASGVFPDMLVPQKYDLGQVLKVMVTGNRDDGQQGSLSVLAVTRQGCVLQTTISDKQAEPTLHTKHLLEGLGDTANKMATLTQVLKEQNKRLKQLNLVAEIISGIKNGENELFKCTTAFQADPDEVGLSRVTFRCTNVSSWTLHRDWRLLVQADVCGHKMAGSQTKVAQLQNFRPGSVKEVSLSVQMTDFPCQVIVTGTLCCQVGETGALRATGGKPGRTKMSTGAPGGTGVSCEAPDTCWVGIPVFRKTLDVPEHGDNMDMLAMRHGSATDCILDILLQQACQ